MLFLLGTAFRKGRSSMGGRLRVSLLSRPSLCSSAGANCSRSFCVTATDSWFKALTIASVVRAQHFKMTPCAYSPLQGVDIKVPSGLPLEGSPECRTQSGMEAPNCRPAVAKLSRALGNFLLGIANLRIEVHDLKITRMILGACPSMCHNLSHTAR